MLILFVYTFFIQSKQSSHVFLQNNHDIFVKSPKTGASLVLASCLPCLCLFGYDTQRYNIIIIKQFFKTFFLRILKIFAEYRTSFDVTQLLPLKEYWSIVNGPIIRRQRRRRWMWRRAKTNTWLALLLNPPSPSLSLFHLSPFFSFLLLFFFSLSFSIFSFFFSSFLLLFLLIFLLLFLLSFLISPLPFLLLLSSPPRSHPQHLHRFFPLHFPPLFPPHFPPLFPLP